MRTALLVFLAFGLAACGTPMVREPEPTPAAVYLAYPTYLQPSADRFSECAVRQPGLSLFMISDMNAQSELPGASLQLQIGGEIPNGSQAYQIGEETLIFIVNADNPTGQLSTKILLAIYTGQQAHWEFESQPEIDLWSYPEEDTLRSWLETRLPGTPQVSSRARIAPDPQAVLQEVLANRGAIGYVPGSWLDGLRDEIPGQVKALSLESSLAEFLIQPVLVISREPLTTHVQILLGCLQQPDN